MAYEVSEVIKTTNQKAVLDALETQLKKNKPYKLSREGDKIKATLIENTFGAITRKDVTMFSLKPKDDAVLCVADVNMRPSAIFFIALIALLFTVFGWIIPIVLYFYQKHVVRSTIEKLLQRVKNECDGAKSTSGSELSQLEALEKLGKLKDSGVLSEDEFQQKKKEIMG